MRKWDRGGSDSKRCRDLSNRSWGKVQRGWDLRNRKGFRSRSRDKRKLVWLEDLVNWNEIACIESRDRCNRCGSYRDRVNKVVQDRSRSIMYKRNRKSQRKCLRDSISGINWLSLTLSISGILSLTLFPCFFRNYGNCSLSLSMSSEMLSAGFCNLRSFQNWHWCNKRSSNWNLRGNRKGNIGSSRSYGDVCTNNTETIDRVSNVVDSLKNTISINILVTAAGHAKSILCFSLGRVNVLIAKAELAKFILSMELA